MFATEDIKEGREILREAPMMPIIQTSRIAMEGAFAVMSEEKKQRLLALHSHCKCGETPCIETKLQKIFETNSYELPIHNKEGQPYQYIYETAARINHACRPNVARGHTKNFLISIRAVEDIKKGDEIVIDYIGSTKGCPRDLRRKLLQAKFGFFCQCKICFNITPIQNLPVRYTWITMEQTALFAKHTLGTKVLGLYTKDELRAYAEVDKWSITFLERIEAMSDMFKNIFIRCACKMKTSKSCQEMQLAACKLYFAKVWRALNKPGIDAETLQHYIDTLFAGIAKDAKNIFSQIEKDPELWSGNRAEVSDLVPFEVLVFTLAGDLKESERKAFVESAWDIAGYSAREPNRGLAEIVARNHQQVSSGQPWSHGTHTMRGCFCRYADFSLELSSKLTSTLAVSEDLKSQSFNVPSINSQLKRTIERAAS